jgi:putative ABC transport system substrate-binding protein
MVYDPVEAGVARDWESSGNNTTGMSSRVPIARLMDSLRLFVSVKRLAVLYTPGEKNSETQLKDLQDVQAQSRITVVPVALTTREEIVEILPEIVRTSDAIYVTGSNMVDSQVALIVQVATRSRVVTITHLEDLVEKGVLIGLCADPHELGRRAGEKAVRILKGARPSSIPIEVSGDANVILNRRTAKAGGFELPPLLLKRVTRLVE